MKKIKELLKKQAFTLVELIIVIAIISMLVVAAFMVLGKWVGHSKDSRKMADIEAISKSLMVWLNDLDNSFGTVPMPNNSGEIQWDGLILFNQGVFGTGNMNKIDSMNKAPINPSTNEFYTYSRTVDGKRYQISAQLEQGKIINSYLNTALAVSDSINIVRGNFAPGIYTFPGTTTEVAVMYLPSITVAENITGSILDIKDNQTFVLDGKGENLVNTYDQGTMPYNEVMGTSKPLDILWSGDESKLGTNSFLDEVDNSLVGMVVTDSVVALLSAGGTPSEPSSNYISCSEDGYEYNDHIYNIPIVTHGSISSVVSEPVSISFGTNTYKMDFTCDNGEITEITENYFETNCEGGYVDNGSQSCVANVCKGTKPSYTTINASAQGVDWTWNYSTTAGNCTYECSTGYIWDGTECKLPMLDVGSHSEADCIAKGGTVTSAGGAKICRFSGGCPSGWRAFGRWSTTSGVRCEGRYSRSKSCRTGYHSWANESIEACNYRQSSSYAYLCRATKTHTGCY